MADMSYNIRVRELPQMSLENKLKLTTSCIIVVTRGTV